MRVQCQLVILADENREQDIGNAVEQPKEKSQKKQ